MKMIETWLRQEEKLAEEEAVKASKAVKETGTAKKQQSIDMALSGNSTQTSKYNPFNNPFASSKHQNYG